MDYKNLCKVSRKFKVELDQKEKEKLKASLDFLGLDVSPEETQSLAKAVGFFGLFISLQLVAVLSLVLGFSLLWLVFPLFPGVLYFYLKKYPILKSESEKRKALSQMPEVMSYLIMSLRINPNIEVALKFSAKHTHDLFKNKLDGIISSIETGTGSAELGLTRLGEEFKKWDEFTRSLKLVISSTLERTEDKRQRTLDKATEVLLDGLATRTQREARALNTPVMIVFTFGVILPLVFVAIIPFMSLMGMEIGAPSIAMIYAVALPLLLFVMIKFIASSRPMTLLPPEIPNQKNSLAWVFAMVVGLVFLLPFFAGEALGAMKYLPLLWGLGAGVGIYLLMTSWKVKKMRKKVKEMESGFGETLHQLGVVLSEGRALEDAMNQVDSDFFKKAVTNIETLNTDMKSAFFDQSYGSLKDVHSATIRGVADILTSISDKGSEAIANVSFRMSEHISNLKKNEDEIERTLGSVISSMKIIAIVVAPLVGGMISSMSVVLADTMIESQDASFGFGSGSAIDPSLITVIIAFYTMASAAILMLFGTELMYGDDNVMKKYSIGLALPIAIFVFTVCAWFANGLFGGMS